MLVVGGKESRIYLLDRDNLGKYNFNYPGDSTTVDPASYDHVVAEYANNGLDQDGEQIYSSATYFNGNFFIGVDNSTAVELNVAAFASGTFTPIHSTFSFGYPAETFIASSNGNTNGVLWVEDPGSGALLAFNASSFTNPIYQSNINPGDSLGGSIHFHTPTEADGMVYAGSRGGGLAGYGLDLSYLNSNPAYFDAPTNLAANELTTSDIHLAWTSNASLATELQIQRSVNGQAWTTLQYVPASTTSYDDTTIAANTVYRYRVIAVSGSNSTASSNTATVALPLILSGSAYYVRLDPNGVNLDIWSNTGPTGGAFQSIVLSQIPSITFNGSGATSSLTVDFSNGDPLPSAGLTFNGSGISTLTVVGDGGNDSVVVNASTMNVTGVFGTAPLSYSGATYLRFDGGAGSNTLTQTTAPGGGASVWFNNLNSTDTLNLSAGSMTIPMPSTGTGVPVLNLGTLLIGAGAQVSLAAPTGSVARALLEVGTLSLAGSAGNWRSRLDLAGNDLLLHSSALPTIDSQIQQALIDGWSGTGLTSSAAASDSTHLTTLGAIVNNDGVGHALYGNGAALGLFDGINPALSDILIRQTYFGDTNLNGTVDGSDYSRIDAAYHGVASGWFNGDFNYDQSIDGSDYTLIDNAFNRQGLMAPASLAITTAGQAITVGTVSANITVQLRNALGAVVNAPPGGITVTLTSTSAGAEFLSGGANVTGILIPAGSSSVSVQYQDLVVGTPLLTFSATGLSTSNQSISILAPATAAQLAITTSPLNLVVGSTSGAMVVSIEDANGNPVITSAGTTLSLTSSNTTGIFKNASGGVITTLVIPAGSSSATFKYTDTTPGIATVTLSAGGLSSSVQQETITAALTSLSFTTPAHRMILGASPATITIQLDDQAGDPFTAGSAGVLINLATNSSGGTFYNAADIPVTSVTVPAGSNSVSLAYRDTLLGTPTLTASASGVSAISQQQAVIPLPQGTVAYYGFNSSSTFLTDTSGSANTLVVSGGSVNYTSTNLPAGFTGAASFSNNGYLSTSSGNFPINVPTGNSTYTIGAWIDINNANKNGIVGWGNWGTTDQVNAFRTTEADAAPDGAGLDNYWWNDDYVQATASLVGNWEYVATTYNGADRSIYVDGQLEGTYTSANQEDSQATNFHIGVTNNTEFFGGTMADLIIANTAFSANQINELYDAVADTPVSLAITTPAHTMILGASPATVTIQLDDRAGNPTSSDSPVVVSLSTNSSGGSFYNSNNGVISSITIPANISSVSVTYRDTRLGSPTITASSAGLVAAVQQQTVSPLPTGTVAFWGFNSSSGLLADASGSGNTLKVAGGTVAYTSAGLLPGFTGAAVFSNNGYLTAASNAFPANVPTGNSSYTIAAWIDINNTNKNGIVGWGNWGTTDQVNAFRTTQGDAGAADGAGLDNYWWNDDYIQPSIDLVNNWVYVAVTYDGNERTIYANGVVLGAYYSPNSDAAAAVNFAVGTTNNRSEFFGGDMADLLIARTALTAGQIDALYNGT